MKCQNKPCKNGCKSNNFTNYQMSGSCGTDYCDGWIEYHCRKCGWFTSSCKCGSCNASTKISSKTWTAILRNQNPKKTKTITVGDSVTDCDGHKGVVVKIIPGIDNENHGTIFVWQQDRLEYGADNCEHYVHYGWEKSLRIVTKS